MVGAVFTEIFVADVFIAVFSVCTAYITAFVAKKLHFVFLLSGGGHKIEVGIILFQI